MQNQINLNQVNFLLQNKQYQQAENALLQLISKYKKIPDLWCLLGIAQRKLNKLKDSELAFKRSIKLAPKQVAAYNNIGNLYTQIGENDKAISSYKTALRNQPTFIDALYNLGVLYLNLEKYELAKEYLTNALKVSPKHLGSLLSLGLLYQKTEHFKKAIKHLDNALALSPQNLIAIQNKAVVLKQQKKFETAIELFKQAIQLNPNIADIYQNLASCYASIGEEVLAEELYQKAITIEPLNPAHHHWYNQMLWTQGNERFLESYSSVLKQFPESSALRRELASKLTQANRFEEAIEELTKASQIEPSNPMNYTMLGTACRNHGDFDGAIKAHKKAKQLSPHDFSVNEALATSLLSTEQADDALNLIKQLLKKKPYHQGAWALKSTALRMLNSDEYYYLNDYEKLVLVEKIETPAGFSSLKEFNQALFETVKKYHVSKEHPLDQSLVTGTQTIDDLFSYDVDLLNLLRKSFDLHQDAFFKNAHYDRDHPALSRLKHKYQYNGSWSVLLRKEGFHKNHYHNKGWYSGPYYVELPAVIDEADDKQGWLKLGEPGFNSVNPLKTDFEIKPEEGMLIRFPSYMWHGTHPYHTDEPRMTVTVDLDVKSKDS